MDHETIRHVLSSAEWTPRVVAEVICSCDLEIPIAQSE